MAGSISKTGTAAPEEPGFDSRPVSPSNGCPAGDTFPASRIQVAQHVIERAVLEHEDHHVLDGAEPGAGCRVHNAASYLASRERSTYCMIPP